MILRAVCTAEEYSVRIQHNNHITGSALIIDVDKNNSVIVVIHQTVGIHAVDIGFLFVDFNQRTVKSRHHDLIVQCALFVDADAVKLLLRKEQVVEKSESAGFRECSQPELLKGWRRPLDTHIVKGKKAESQNKHKNDNKAGDPVKKPIHTTPYGFSFPSGFGSFRVYFGRIAPVVCQVICFLFLHVIIPQSSE